MLEYDRYCPDLPGRSMPDPVNPAAASDRWLRGGVAVTSTLATSLAVASGSHLAEVDRTTQTPLQPLIGVTFARSWGGLSMSPGSALAARELLPRP